MSQLYPSIVEVGIATFRSAVFQEKITLDWFTYKNVSFYPLFKAKWHGHLSCRYFHM